MALLEIKNLSVDFQAKNGVVHAVRNVSYKLDTGEMLGIVGESGSGKSVGMLALMGLLAKNGRVVSGQMLFDGRDISPLAKEFCGDGKACEKAMEEIRGVQIGMIFQDPMTYLNPVLKIGTQITEGIIKHEKCTREEAKNRAVELMKQVGIPSPEDRFHQYPFEFSGGMRQRIVIAAALACRPKLIIADEPTTALDVTVQAQIIDLLMELAERQNMAVIMITHDLGVVSMMCEKVNIMYAGKIVERGSLNEIFYETKHFYTQGLLSSVVTHGGAARQSLLSIPGTPPDLLKLNSGCAFMPRCTRAMNICKDYGPAEKCFGEGHCVSCWHYCMDRADEIVKAQEG